MATLMTAGSYTFPDLSIDGGYLVNRDPVMTMRENARRVTIGEFARWRYTITGVIPTMTAAEFKALSDALDFSGSDALTGVSVTFDDPWTNSTQTKTFIPRITPPDLQYAVNKEYRNVQVTLIEQ